MAINKSGNQAEAQNELRLRQLDRLASIGTLSAGMAHEIRNAFVPVRTFLDLLLEKHHDDELAAVVRKEMGRIDSILTRMLRFSGPTKSAMAAIGLHELLERSLRLIQPQREGKSIELIRSFKAAADVVNGDEDQLQHAFVNLFLNALEAMGPHGKLTVTSELIPPGPGENSRGVVPPQIQISISDTGIGIPPENVNRIFESFFTTKPNGTGLGLAITQRIIHEHRGTISVQTALSQGTTFTILLPAG
jgi:two-component system nitrogen regulation sensor histidine kinase GlnL